MDLFVGRKVAVGLGPRYVSSGRLLPPSIIDQGFDLVGDCIYKLLLARCLKRGYSVHRGVG
jgi:hypothetical protein